MTDTSATAFSAGTVLAETYELTRQLGRGGMGAVWEAKHRRLPGKRVAVKVLLAAPDANSTAYARFRREAEIASRLGHPNIVEVLDFNSTQDGLPYMVLEFLEGQDLEHLLEAGPLDLGQALDIVRQVGRALIAVHAQGVVHRDLKPANIFLLPGDEPGSHRVKVLDFGISKIKGQDGKLTATANVVGTPSYMSPEQVRGDPDVDARTDVFALAVILHEMLTGERVFGGDTLPSIVLKVVSAEVPALDALLPRTPPHVARAVARALRKEPASRTASVKAFLDELSDPRSAAGAEAVTVTGRPVTGLSPAAPAPAHPPAPGRGPLPFVLAGILLLLAGLGAVLLQSRRPPPQVEVTRAAPRVPAEAAPGPEAKGPPVPAQPAPEVPREPPAAGAAEARPEVKEGSAGHRERSAPVERPQRPPPPEVAALLDEADQALQAGRAAEARSAAERALRRLPEADQEGSRAHSIITSSYCQEKSLVDAAPAFRRVTAAAERRRVRAFCRAQGLSLE